MDTLEFLRAILPEAGVHYVGLMKRGLQGVAHKAFTSLEEMAAFIVEMDAKREATVYHACSTYQQPYVEAPDPKNPGQMKRVYRVPENAYAAKALWVDLDCGEEKAAKGKGYPDKKAAATAIVQFCRDTGYPAPLLVDSGNGIHAYWPFTEAVDAATWRSLASNFKAVLAHFGVLADPTRTADFASILRPVGTHNKKDPDNWKPVVAKTAAKPYDVAVIQAKLEEIVSKYELFCEQVPSYATADLNDDLTAHAYPNIPSDANLVYEKCQQVRMIVGDGCGYDHWRGVIGILKYCENGEQAAHEWSSSYAAYDEVETQKRLDTWNSPPTTCEYLSRCNPSGCEGCQFKDKVKTPLVLGRVEVETPEQVVEAVVDGREEKVEVPAVTKGYAWDESSSSLIRYTVDKDGVLSPNTFCHVLFYPTTRICQADGSFMVRIRMHLPDKRIRDFDVATATIAAGGVELLKALGDKEIMPSSHKGASEHITAYLRESLNRLMKEAQEMNTMTSFGWRNDMKAFLLGDRLYHADGTVTRVILGGYAAANAVALQTPKEPPKGWVDGVDFLYNREGMLPMQYAVCSAFGSLLGPLCEKSYKGIPVALTGDRSGKGKSTACKIALYAFGDAEALSTNGKDGITQNAMWAKMGAFQNIPMLIDEITGIKGKDLSALMYAASNGKEKERMTVSKGVGVTFANTSTWNMSLFLTANKYLAAELAAEKANTEAEAVRFIEIRTDMYDIPKLDTVQVAAAEAKVARAAGAAGEEYVKYLVQNLDAVNEKFIDICSDLIADPMFADNTQYRFYRQHVACTLTAATVMHDLGLVKFDLTALREWAMEHIRRLCGEVQQNNVTTPEDALVKMISDLTPRIITTEEYRAQAHSLGPEKVSVHNAIAGRYIIGRPDGKEPMAGRLYLVKADMRDWCLKNRVDMNSIIAHADSHGYLIHEADDRFRVTRGTNAPENRVRCFAFDMMKMNGAEVPLASVTPLRPVGEEQVVNG